MIFGPFAGSSLVPPSTGNAGGASEVRASATAVSSKAAGAIPETPTSPRRAPNLRSLARTVFAFIDAGFGDAELAVLAIVWVLGFIWWLSDERVREHLWRQIGI